MKKTIEYVIVRSGRKTTCITVGRDCKVVVKAPLFASVASIDRFVRQNTDWIEKKIEKMQSVENKRQRNLGDKDVIMYLGKGLRLVEMDVKGFVYMENFLACPIGFTQNDLIAWYKKTALDYYKKRVPFLAEKYGFSYSVIRLSNATKRWGCCSAKSVIGLQWRLIMAPENVVDSVILHELSHTKELNHSKDFWNIVYSTMPDYDVCRAWLNENSYILDLYR